MSAPSVSSSAPPPLFKNFGKSLKDLLEKKFEFNRELKVKTSTSNGLTFESTGRAGKGGDFTGILKTTYKRTDFGTTEVELDTDGKAKASIEADKLAKNFVAKVNTDQDRVTSLDLSYRHEYFSDNLIVTADKKAPTVEGTAVVGVDGLSVGAQAKYDFAGSGSLKDYNAGAEYSQPDFTLTARTADSTDKIRLGYFHIVNSDINVGGQYEVNLTSISPVTSHLFTVCSSFAIDRDTLVKGKFDSRGIVTGALEQRLYNPKLKYNLAAEFNTRQSIVPDKFGISFTLGDS